MVQTLALPKPKYRVETAHTEEGHFYKATFADGISATYPGVTGYLNIIGGEKTNRLMGWTKKQSLLVFQNALNELMKGKKKAKVELTQEWIEATRKSAWVRTKALKDEAADIGTRAHAYIDAFIKGLPLPQKTPDIAVVVDNFLAWLKQTGTEIVCGDVKVASRPHGYGGAADAIGFRNGRYGVLDWKSSNYINPEYALQVGGAYSHAIEETYGIVIDWAEIVRFDKVLPIFEHKLVSNLPAAFQGFVHAKGLSEIMSMELYAA